MQALFSFRTKTAYLHILANRHMKGVQVVGWVKRQKNVGFAALILFYLIPIVCKLCGISPAFSGTQPTLRDGKFL